MNNEQTSSDGSGADVFADSAPFGTTADGELVDRITLRNANGITVQVLTYGGIIQLLEAPDRHGEFADIVLGFDTLEDYEQNSPYFGAIVGRFANRIANGRFELEGRTYELAVNNGPNHLHGGLRGFDKVVWAARTFQSDGEAGVVLAYTSPDGEEGYPGTLSTTVTYTLNNRDALQVDYVAETDAATPINLTQHSYFNLSGAGTGDILDHELTIFADHFTPVDEALIPTGEIRPVRGTPLDFSTTHRIGDRIDDASEEQIAFGRGYDHNFVLDREGQSAGDVTIAARVYEPESGRVLEVYTTEPGMQLYTGNFLNGSHVGKDGIAYEHRAGFCLETQHFPNSPNQPEFPSTILQPGEEFRSTTVFAFSTR